MPRKPLTEGVHCQRCEDWGGKILAACADHLAVHLACCCGVQSLRHGSAGAQQLAHNLLLFGKLRPLQEEVPSRAEAKSFSAAVGK